MRAEGHGIFELLHASISCAPPSISVFAHFSLLYYVQKVIVFMSNSLVAQSAGISIFLIKGDKNGKSGRTTIRAWIKYIIVEIFSQIGGGLNNVLAEDVVC